MDFRHPLAVVTPTLDGDVLTALARANQEFSGRQLARQIGHGSPEGVRRAADRLVTQGIVRRRTAGPAHLYQLNRDHVAAPWIEGLAGIRTQLIDRLRDLIDSWEHPPLVVLIFGSAARGEARESSDIDILVIRHGDCDPESEPWQDQVMTLRQQATAWAGNDTRLLEYSEDELATASAEPVLEDALRDGIELFGSRRILERLLRGRVGR